MKIISFQSITVIFYISLINILAKYKNINKKIKHFLNIYYCYIIKTNEKIFFISLINCKIIIH